MTDRCCKDPSCRRKQPILLRRADFSGDWYVITKYTRLPNGTIRSEVKHRLDDATQKALNEAFGRLDLPGNNQTGG